MFYPYEGFRSVTPLDAARVNMTIFRNHSVHCYYIRFTLIKGMDYNKHDNINIGYVTVYRIPIRLPAKSALTWPVV